MIDENAFGLLVSYYEIEQDEYGLERDEFVKRYRAFVGAVEECVEALPLGRGVRCLDLGHAVYFELAEGDETEDPLGWLRLVRARLTARDFVTLGLLTYGSRWVDEPDAAAPPVQLGDVRVLRASLPSEALRRALYGDAAGRQDEDCPGWGPGLYVDTEALEPLGRKLKNAPTALMASGATFYRFGA
jgi:hypothetical protein